MLVKICGLSNRIDAMAAVECGADAIGFVMGGKVLPVEVEPHAQTVREIIKDIPKGVDSFVVTHLTEAGDIIKLSEYVQSTGIQISEDIELSKLKAIRKLTNKKIIKTVVVNDTAFDKLKQVQDYCDYILLDTRFGGYTGGTGVTSDFEMCRKLVLASKKPVYLAGGLTADNLSIALNKVHPTGADVSTGVSTYSESYLRKDRKDSKKIQEFISTAKQWSKDSKEFRE